MTACVEIGVDRNFENTVCSILNIGKCFIFRIPIIIQDIVIFVKNLYMQILTVFIVIRNTFHITGLGKLDVIDFIRKTKDFIFGIFTSAKPEICFIESITIFPGEKISLFRFTDGDWSW